MTLKSVRVLVRFNFGGKANELVFFRDELTYHSAAATIRECYPELWPYIRLHPHRFFIPITYLPDGTIFPEINVGARNLTHICAALRLLGWSGNLYYAQRDGDTKPDWHWSRRVVHHPHGLP